MRRHREYTTEELELYQKYVNNRRAKQPDKCTGGYKCWVEKGPPAISRNLICMGCGEMPKGVY